MGDFTIFAPNNDAMARLNRRNEDPNLLWKYHIVPGRYDDQTIYNMAQEKFNQANPRQMSSARPQNNLPTVASPFQVGQRKRRGTSEMQSNDSCSGFLWDWLLRWCRSVH